MNTLFLVLLLLFIDANVAATESGRIHLRGRRAESNKLHEPQHKNAESNFVTKLKLKLKLWLRNVKVAEDSKCQCQNNDIDLVGTKWNLTHFVWHGDPDEGEETLRPVNLTQERRGMTHIFKENGSISGSCGNNLCWGTRKNIAYKMYRIPGLATTRMMSTPQERAYIAMLTRSPYIYNTCVDSCTNRTKLQLFQVEKDDAENLVPSMLMAEYDQLQRML